MVFLKSEQECNLFMLSVSNRTSYVLWEVIGLGYLNLLKSVSLSITYCNDLSRCPLYLDYGKKMNSFVKEVQV